MGRLYDTTPLKVWDLLDRGGRNIVRIEAEDDFKETVYYSHETVYYTHNRALTHRNFSNYNSMQMSYENATQTKAQDGRSVG